MEEIKGETNQGKKLVAIGDGSTRKTSLFVTHTRGEYPNGPLPHLWEACTSTITIDDESVVLDLWDTIGQECMDRLRPLLYPNTDIFLVVFALDSKISFENVLTKWSKDVKKHCKGIPVVLVGTKKDMRNENADMISYAEGSSMAERIGAVQYLECSSLLKEGVTEVFECAAKVLIQLQRKSVSKENMTFRKRFCRVT